MAIDKVSFGSVVAVSGKPAKVNRLNSKMRPYINTGYVMVQDVTPQYIYAPSTGVMAQAAQRGENVSIYITDADVDKVKQKKSNWDTTESILSNLKAYYNINKIRLNDAVSRIINS
ncbi:hypothetical protein IJ182_10265 [bacterium]|nr:hypothetical protein [bacterium]